MPPLNENNSTVIVREVRSALVRIHGFESFSRSKRNRQLLSYLVEQALEGQSERLKGYRIAVDVFGKDADFDAQNNPLVRNQMVRLRRALEHYYLAVGDSDQVQIRFNKGEYAPVFVCRDELVTGSTTKQGCPTADTTEKPVLMILPFVSLEESGERGQFSAGLSCELTAALSRFDHLQIISVGSDSLKIQTTENRCYFLQGQSRQYAQKLRINLELTEQETGICLWAEKFECDLNIEDIFELQDRVTREVASEVADHYGIIPRRLMVNLQNSPPSSLSAYEAVLGFYHYELDLKEELLPGVIKNLELALVIEPGYALAWAALAEAYADCFVYGYCYDQALLDKSRQHSDKAISLDPACQHAHWSRGLAYHLSPGQQDIGISRAAIDTLLAINPNAAGFVSGSGLLLALQGEWQKGLMLIQQFSNPYFHSPRWINLARQLFGYLEGDFQESLTHSLYIKTEMAPWDVILKALCCWNLDRKDEACSAFDALIELNPVFGKDQLQLENFIAAFIKDRRDFLKIMDDLMAISSVGIARKN